jgi:hypothetical protein
VPLAIGEQMQRELPHARLVAYPGCGHLAIVECRDRLLPEVEEFLASVGIPSARTLRRRTCAGDPSPRFAGSG